MSKPPKKGFFDRLTSSRRIHSLWMQIQDPNITSTRGKAICTELLGLLSDESINPNKCEVYTRRGDFFSSKGNYDRAIQDYARGIESSRKINVWYSVLDYAEKRDLSRRKEIWFSVDLAEDRMRSANNKKIFNTLQTGSPKANLWENILFTLAEVDLQ